MFLTSTEAKWISIFGISIGSFVIGVIPACYIARGYAISRQLILSALLCFGGGVLLATSVLHMLPETRELLPHYAELVFCCGFFLLYFIDEIVHYIWFKDDASTPRTQDTVIVRDVPDRRVDRGHQRTPSSTCYYHGLPNRKSRYQESTKDDVYEIGFKGAGRNLAVRPSGSEGLRALSYEPDSIPNTNRPIGFGSAATNKPKYGHYGTLSPTTSETSRCYDIDTFEGHGHNLDQCTNTNMGHVGLSFALTLHSILEGLAIGLQRDTSEVLLLAGAVVSHKFVVAFCLGLELTRSNSTLFRNVLAISLFSVGSALGIGIGMLALNVEGSWASTLIPVLQGLAAGTLLYVTVSEVLPRERAHWHSNKRRCAGIVQFVSVIIGFSVIYFLNGYLDNHHHHVQPRG